MTQIFKPVKGFYLFIVLLLFYQELHPGRDQANDEQRVTSFAPPLLKCPWVKQNLRSLPPSCEGASWLTSGHTWGNNSHVFSSCRPSLLLKAALLPSHLRSQCVITPSSLWQRRRTGGSLKLYRHAFSQTCLCWISHAGCDGGSEQIWVMMHWSDRHSWCCLVLRAVVH